MRSVATVEIAPVDHEAWQLSVGRKRWMLALLTIGYSLNLLDRQILSIMAEPIKRDLGLADWQLGALTGLSFALLYSVAALPIARLADRSNRVAVIGTAIFAWSLFTAACGMAASFLQMLLLRIGVGLGEAGGGPPSQSLIADSYPPERRASALSILAMGSPIGVCAGMVFGGLFADLIGWRWTLVAAGAPGLIIGLLVLLTLRDPHRAGQPVRHEAPTLGATLAMLTARRAFLLMAFGSALLSFITYGVSAFVAPFYLRNHLAEITAIGASVGLKPLSVLGIALGVFGAGGGLLGAICGGRLGDRFGMRDARALALIPAVGSVLTAISFTLAFTTPSAVLSLIPYALGGFCANLWYGPATLGLQRLAGAGSKATALAVALFVNSAIGLSFGPLVIGLLSDVLEPSLGSAGGLRAGLLIGMTAGLASALCYWLASRRIGAEIVEVEGESA